MVAGGATRQESVALALAAVPDDEVVLVHDAARPLTPSDLFDLVAAAVVATGGGVVPALPVADTVKQVDGRRRASRPSTAPASPRCRRRRASPPARSAGRTTAREPGTPTTPPSSRRPACR